MTARDVLAEVLRAGGRVIRDPDRPRLMVPQALKPLVLEHRDALRALVLAAAPGKPERVTPLPAVMAPDRPRRPSYAFPWPDAMTGLGARKVGPFDSCQRCGRGSWVRYGNTVLCLACAKRAC